MQKSVVLPCTNNKAKRKLWEKIQLTVESKIKILSNELCQGGERLVL